MQKAQVFLTEKQKIALKALSAKTGLKQSAIIRRGVDLAIAEAQRKKNDWKTSLMRTKGIWRDRDDIEKTIADNRAAWARHQTSLPE